VIKLPQNKMSSENKEDVKMSKSLRKTMKKSTDKFVRDLYFNPKKRNEFRKTFVEGRDSFLEILEQPMKPNPTVAEAQNRAWADTFADQMERMVDTIDNVVPKNLKSYELTDTHFKLFKKPNNKFLAIECRYKKGIPKKRYITCLLIPSGFPTKQQRTRVQMIRGLYDLKGFEVQDEGTFTQKFLSFVKVRQTFKGKKRTVKFELTQRGEIKDNNWLRII